MRATVLIEKVGKKYRASTSQPISLESEGKSGDEALERLLDLAGKRITAGQLLEITLPGTAEVNPWQTFAGIWKNHPDYDAFLKNIAEYRRSVNRPSASA